MSILRTALATGIATLLCGCGDSPEKEAEGPAVIEVIEPSLLEKRGLFNPKKGEEWVYRVTREVPISTQLSDEDALQIVGRHDEFYELAFERKRVCAGVVPVGESGEELLRIDIFDDGELAEQVYSKVTSKGWFGRGAARTPGAAPVLHENTIPIAVPGMRGGYMWRAMNKGKSREYKFRVIDRLKLELPAGTFDVAQIQIDSGSGMKSYQKSLWFAENVGIVKEVTTHFGTRSIEFRETSELVAWNLPNGRSSLAEKEEAPAGPEPASAPAGEQPEL